MYWKNLVIAALVITLIGVCAVVFTLETTNNRLESTNDYLVVQNVQLTKDIVEAKRLSFQAGLIVCSNEDIEYFNNIADEVPGTIAADFFHEMAQNWAYDGGRIEELTEAYMNGESH